MRYKMDMSQEKEIWRDLFPAGKRRLLVVSMNFQTSKGGNEMFETILEDTETGGRDRFFLLVIEGKRWLLKSLLEATGTYKKDEHNNYDFDTDDIVGKIVWAEIVHQNEEYIDKNGKDVKTVRNNLKRFILPPPTQAPTGSVGTNAAAPEKSSDAASASTSNGYVDDDDPDIPF